MNAYPTSRILFLFGTRPEAIKLCPIFLALRARQLPYLAVNTGQHRDMVQDVLTFFGCRADVTLDVMREGQDLITLTQRLMGELGTLFRRCRPRAVAVHGDTATAHAGMLSAYLEGIPVYHIEAGLRSGNPRAPCPEEYFRCAIDAASELCFAPTQAAAAQLLREGKPPSDILLCGNTATDAVRLCLRDAPADPACILRAARPLDGEAPLPSLRGKRLILLTAHRRETDQASLGTLLGGIRHALERIEDAVLVFPVHPSPRVRRAAVAAFRGCPQAHLIEPLPLPYMQRLLARATLLLTDSGGLQEEAVYLGIPTLVLREVTERPEGVAAGVLRLVGTDGTSVGDAMCELLTNEAARDAMARPSPCFGDGYAADRIAEQLKSRGIFD